MRSVWSRFAEGIRELESRRVPVAKASPRWSKAARDRVKQAIEERCDVLGKLDAVLQTVVVGSVWLLIIIGVSIVIDLYAQFAKTATGSWWRALLAVALIPILASGVIMILAIFGDFSEHH